MDISTLASSKDIYSMSSLDISNITGSRHDNVKRAVESLMLRKIIRLYEPVHEPFIDCKGRSRTMSMYVFSGESGMVDSYSTIAKISPQSIVKAIEFWRSTENTLSKLLEALQAFDVPEEFSDMYVYAIQEVSTGNIKLGISSNPERRCKQLQTANSSELKLLVSILATDRFKFESKLHNENKDLRIRGEWFKAEIVQRVTKTAENLLA